MDTAHSPGQASLDLAFDNELDRMLEEAPPSTRGGYILKRGISYLHEALADWMLINPGGTLREMGFHFGYSPAWICTVVNSDMFKAYMSARRETIVSSIAGSLPQKLEAAAHLATERVIEVISKSQDSDQILDAFDKVMHRYGYAPNAKNGAQAQQGTLQQNNVFFISPDGLQKAREILVEQHDQPALPAPES